MKAIRTIILVTMLSGLLLPACRPTPADLVATATLAANSFARLTAQTPTSTPTWTPNPTATSTPTSDPTAIISPTSTATQTPTPTPFPTLVTGMSAGQYLAESEKLTKEGNWDGAMIAVDQAIRLAPLSINPYSKRNWLRNNLDDLRNLAILEQTIQQLNKSIQQDPSNPALYFERGKAKYLHTILSGEPKKVKSLASVLAASGWNIQGDAGSIISLDMKEAIIDLDKSIKIDPERAEAYHWRGLAHHLQALQYYGVSLHGVNSDEIRSAIENYRLAIDRNPELAEAYNDLGTAYVHLYPRLGDGVVDTKKGETIESALEDIRNALQFYDKAIEQRPDQVNYYLNRTRAFHLIALNSNADSARKILQPWLDDANTAVELEPNKPWGYLTRAAVFVIYEKLSNNKTEKENYHKRAEEDYKIYRSKAGK